MASIEPELGNESTADLGDDLKLQPDGTVKKGERLARADDVPERFDLPLEHPLYGKRVIRHGMSGWTDSTIDDEGRVVPIEKPDADPIGEIERDR